METLNFGTAPAPALRSGRNVEPNPFDNHFPTKVAEDGSDIALTLDLPGTAETNKAKVTEYTGKARRAAARLATPMTARIQVKEEGTGKTAKTTMFIWTVAKIARVTADQTADGQPASE